MEIDVAALKRMIAEKNTTMEGMALFLGIDRSTLYRKLRDGGGGITVHDAHMIASFLGLSDHETIRIFWSAGKKPDANHRRKICCLPRSDGVF